MNENRCFHEYETITDEDLVKAVQKNSELQKYFTSTFDGVKASQYCGILNVEGDDFYILPKITSDEQHNLDTFIYMLMYAFDIEIKNEDLSGSENQQHRLFQILINVFTDLNNFISEKLGSDFQIGHSYFMNYDDLDFVLDYKIKPLLEEYFFADEYGLEEVLTLLKDQT